MRGDLQRGRQVADLLARVWRDGALEPVAASAEVTTLLVAYGCGALAWWRLRDSPLAGAAVGEQLRDAYRLHTLQAAVHERRLVELFQRLNEAGHQVILGKGWAIARHYPEQGLRPYADVDLWAAPDAYSAIARDLERWALPAPVELQASNRELADRDFVTLFEHARCVDLGGVEVRVFDPADHLRLICLHLLRHGAGRPQWLVDVAVALETRPPDFSWQRFLTGDPLRSQWAVDMLRLAHELLGADLADTPGAAESRSLPGWAPAAVLAQWGRGFRRQKPLFLYLDRPRGLLTEVRSRWPNPIEATIERGLRFEGRFAWPRQLAAFGARGLGFLRKLQRALALAPSTPGPRSGLARRR